MMGRTNSQILESAQYQFKVLIIGESGVGKTSIKVRYTDNKFTPDLAANVGVDFKKKAVQISPTEIVKLIIWDTAGSEKYRSLAKSYLNNSQGILLCFDLTNRKSFEELNNFWLNFIKEYIDTGVTKKKVCIVYLVGNKNDLKNREVSYEEAKEFSKGFGGEYFETSALTGDGIEDMFFDLAKDMVEKLESNREEFGESSGNRSCFIKLKDDSSAEVDDRGVASSSGCC